MRAVRVLVTGFEPFGGERVNPSWEAAGRLHGRAIGPARVEARCLPVRWAGVGPALAAALDEVQPAAVILAGQAAGRAGIALERIGINVREGVDEAGEEGGGAPVVPGGPDGLFATLPLAEAVAALRAAGIPAYVSNSAGTYLCNAALYLARHELLRRGRGDVPVGFVHVPLLPEQAARADRQPPPSMALADIVRALEIVVEATVRRVASPAQADIYRPVTAWRG